jgi:ATP-binding cassette, subfamily C, bacterial exporter for protease/lipase
MKTSAFFDRSPLTRVLWTFRREFLLVGLFSAVVNLLMLTPTIYMLQIYDRVLVSLSELTLLAISMICLFLFSVIAFSEWTRSRILVRAGVRLDEALGTRVFNSSFEAQLDSSGANPQRAFSDLLQLRQFLTGQGIFAFFDAPWIPIYLAVMFFLHPFLGLMSILFACAQIGLAWWGHRQTAAPAEAAARAGTDVHLFVQGKLRNAEVLESMGMVGQLRLGWGVLWVWSAGCGSTAPPPRPATTIKTRPRSTSIRRCRPQANSSATASSRSLWLRGRCW